MKDRVQRVLPTGGNLAEGAWRARHRGLRMLLLLHVPLLLGLGFLNQGEAGRDTLGYSTVQLLLEVAPVVVLFLVSVKGTHRVQAGLVATGLAWCSIVTVHLSGGSPAAHFHFFVMLAAVTVYQDWVPFSVFLAVAVSAQVVALGIDTGIVFDGGPQAARPATWTLIHVAALLAEAVALVLFWQMSETEQERAATLAVELGNAELIRSRDQSEQRRAASELLTNLARRNQGLLSRQLAKIDQLEQAETDPGQLAELFTLDHLATRMRRNAESLLVLSGEEPPRRWSEPVALSEVVRGAIAEVEDYTRADVLLQQDVAVVGRAVGDMVHLLAELIENATSFSAPSTRVVISGGRGQTGGFIVSVADSGVSMGDTELATANRRLASATSDVGLTLSGMLGFHVVARLAGRYGVRVWLTRGARAGLVAMVALPDELLAPVLSGGPVATVPAPAEMHVQYATAGAPAPVQAGVMGGVMGAVTGEGHVPAQPTAADHHAAPQPVWAETVTFPPLAAPPAWAAPAQATSPEWSEPAAPAAPAWTPVEAPQPAWAAPVAVETLAVPVETAAVHAPETGVAVPPPIGALPPETMPVVELPAPTTSGGLARRVRGASLAPQIAAEPGVAEAPSIAAQPERARSLLSAYTSGLAQGRAASAENGPPPTGEEHTDV